jgi:ribosomal protein S18 acetylase RimI-like enzyme
MLLIPFDRERTLNVMFTAMMMTPAEREVALQNRFTRKDWLDKYADCEVLGFQMAGEIAGGAIFQGNHLHISVLPHYRSRWFPLCQKVVNYGFRKYGNPLIARVNARNARALAFVQQVGCVEQSRDDISVTFLITPEGMRYRKRG